MSHHACVEGLGKYIILQIGLEVLVLTCKKEVKIFFLTGNKDARIIVLSNKYIFPMEHFRIKEKQEKGKRNQ